MRSPVVNNRNMAINALEAHPAESWGPDLVQTLDLAIAQEPRDDVRDRLRALVGRP